MPYPVIQHSYASPLGVNLSRAIMSNWILTSYRDWLSPVVGLLHTKLLVQEYLHNDETPVQVMNEPGRKNTTDSYMWVYCSIKGVRNPIRQFVYQPGRSGKYPQSHLEGYHGFIHTDAYKGYEKVTGIIRCVCWSHLRRYFVDALPKESIVPMRQFQLQRLNISTISSK